MFKETVELELSKLKENQIVWSAFFKCYIKYVGTDFDDDYCFEYLHKPGFCIILITSKIYQPPLLIQELL
jgi:hypothetical protein